MTVRSQKNWQSYAHQENLMKPELFMVRSGIPTSCSGKLILDTEGGVRHKYVIYRYGTNPGNLTPRNKDKYTGLSFSTIPRPGAAKTTIEAVNATGMLYVLQDGPTHVSIRPVGASMDVWIQEGSSSI